jgi:hypothetical protein
MKIKDLKRFYVESPQNNPINYITLYKNKEGLINTTNWFKCRDFFNDVIAAKNKFFFYIHGFENKRVKFNDEGLYVGVKNLLDKNCFIKNLESWITNELGESITWFEEDDVLVILFSNKVLETTYNISLFSWMLRQANTTKILKSFEDAVSNCNEILSLPSYKVIKYKFNSPIKGYWFWFSNEYNSMKDQHDCPKYMIHNNGMNNFLTLLKET